MGGGFPSFQPIQFQNPQDKADYDLYYSGMSDQQKMQETLQSYSFGGGGGMFYPLFAAQNAVQQGRAKRQANEAAAAQKAAADQAAAQKAAADAAAAQKAAADKAAADKAAKDKAAADAFAGPPGSSGVAGGELVSGGAGADSLPKAPTYASPRFVQDGAMPKSGIAEMFGNAVSPRKTGSGYIT